MRLFDDRDRRALGALLVLVALGAALLLLGALLLGVAFRAFFWAAFGGW